MTEIEPPLLPTFMEFPKIARLSRDCIITEKIDGTNGSILIGDECKPYLLPDGQAVPFLVGSRNRWLTLEADNFGFARWAYTHADELLKLGPGHHFGEWWGSGIQRGYGLVKGEKRFSLFNVTRWKEARDNGTLPLCVSLVPILYSGIFHSHEVEEALDRLRLMGSFAAPGFMKPEGVVVWHSAARVLFKKTLEKDEMPKGQVAK